MKNSLSLMIACMAIFMLSCNQQKPLDLTGIDPGHYDSTWYNREPIRIIQTNLREIDVDLDIDVYIKALVDASATAVIFNVGGIRANYPTSLPYHFKNPYLTDDKLIDKVIKGFHENGIKFIARFDMSKVNESIADQMPDWLYVGTDGKTVNYNGEVHTCVTGGYQQEYAFKILEEAISSYPFDGVFFNMAGFTTSDYSEVYHGLCQCNNCKKKFKEYSGLRLPLKVDVNDPVYLKYREWQGIIKDDYSERIKTLFHSLDPDLVYVNPEGPLQRSESGTSFTSKDYWTYHATENTKKILGSSSQRMPCDNFNYLMGMDYRHTATSPNIARIYLAEQMLNGAGPGIYYISSVENQLDREFQSGISEIFKFHKTNEKLFTNTESRAKVGLIMGSPDEYRGLIRLLSEEHIMYDLIQSSALGKDYFPRDLDSYDALILANVTGMDQEFVSLIDKYVEDGGHLLVTGFPGIKDNVGNEVNNIRLQCLGVNPEFQMYSKAKSTYLKVENADKEILGKDEFENFDVIMMYTNFMKCQPDENAKTYLKLIENAMHGPPEKCYIKEEDVSEFPGIIYNDYGKGSSVFIPWLIGEQYNWKGNNAHRALFIASMRNLLKIEDRIITNCSPLIEMTHFANRNGAFEWIGMINHSGQIGDVYRDPVPVYNSVVRFQPGKPVKSVHLLRSGTSVKFRQEDGWLECTVPEVLDFEVLVCLYK